MKKKLLLLNPMLTGYFFLLASFSIPALFCQGAGMENQPAAAQVLQFMHQSLANIQAYSYYLKATERRTSGEFHRSEALVSIQKNPLKISFEGIRPNKGVRVEYDQQQSHSEAEVMPQKWAPAIRVSYDIQGKTLRRGHHSIDETSLCWFGKVIRHQERQLLATDQYPSAVRHLGETRVDGRRCFRVEILDPGYRLYPLRVAEGETLLSIARKYTINPYKILEINPELEDYQDVKTGDMIRIPSSYSKRSVIMIDTETFLPRQIEIYDEKGLFEAYEFGNLKTQ